MMTMYFRPLAKTLHLALLLSLSGPALSACSTALPPPELVEARATYERAAKGPANELAPAQLDTAKQALSAAERSLNDDGDGPRTRDLAYIAARRSEIAEAEANRSAAERDRAQADKNFKNAQLEGIQKTKEQLEAERREAAKAQNEASKTKAELETERKARADAEKRASAAMASLAEIAKVKEESRGIVITLSGSVLFATGKSELLPIAQQKLDDVAKALKDQGFKSILVEGHTDSRGSAADNDKLSLKRAEAVRDLLVARGIPATKIRAQGLGSSRSVADNATVEGRANNRRVEIVVEPDK